MAASPRRGGRRGDRARARRPRPTRLGRRERDGEDVREPLCLGRPGGFDRLLEPCPQLLVDRGLLERVGPAAELLAEPDALDDEGPLGLDPPGARVARALPGLLAHLGALAGEGGLVVGDCPEAADLVDLGAALPHRALELVDDRIGLALPGERSCELRVRGNAGGLGEIAEPLELGLEARDRRVQLPLLLVTALLGARELGGGLRVLLSCPLDRGARPGEPLACPGQLVGGLHLGRGEQRPLAAGAVPRPPGSARARRVRL